MSKYYIDCEFLEGTQKEKFPISLFRKETKPTIDLISIALVEEDIDAFSKRNGLSDRAYKGREYYAISKDFNLEEAWNRYDLKPDINNGGMKKVYWIRENVLRPIYYELCLKDEEPLNSKNNPLNFSYKTLKNLINKYGKTNKQIAEEIKNFVYYKINMFNKNEVLKEGTFVKENIKFYSYFGSYDWVVFCQLFGKMIDLPIGFPKYCFDLKQELDRKANVYDDHFMFGKENFETKLSYIKNKSNYPKQSKDHNALADARFNKQLHQFLNEL
jgi:hypothetical protein